jgi:hypothetical protein
MRFTCRLGFGTLVFVGSVIALNNGPDLVSPWAGVAVAASNTLNAGGTSEDGEIWVTAQNTNELKILLGMGGIETVVLPAGTAPHTISFSPDGSYEDTSYGPIGVDLHALVITANEKTAYITARGMADEIKVLNLNGSEVRTILIDPRPGIADRPDSLRGRAAICTPQCASQARSPGSKRRPAEWITSM